MLRGSQINNMKKLLGIVALASTLISNSFIVTSNILNHSIFQNTDTIAKTIIANAQGGNVEKHCIDKERGYYHSQLTPTGIFVTKEAKITIQLPENVDNSFSIFIGQWGIYQNLNNGQDLAPKEYIITHQSESLVSNLEGMLYVTNKSENNDYQVLIIAERTITVPTFIAVKQQMKNLLIFKQQPTITICWNNR